MSPSKIKYKEAVQAAKEFAYGRIQEIPEHFDERQTKIFNSKAGHLKSQFDYFESVNNDMWLAYTGKTEAEYYLDKELKNE